MAKPRKRRAKSTGSSGALKITGGSGALQAQSLQKTLTWTNPLKFLQNTRFKSFLGDDDREAADGPHHHSALNKKIGHHLDKIQRWKGKRSLEHVLPQDEPLHKKLHHHLNKIEERTGKRSLSHAFPPEPAAEAPGQAPAEEPKLSLKKKKSVFDGLFGKN